MTIEDCDQLIARTRSANPDFDLGEIRALAETCKGLLEAQQDIDPEPLDADQIPAS